MHEESIALTIAAVGRSRFRMSVVSLAVTSASHLIFAVGGDFSWPSIWGVKPGSPDG